MRNLKSVKFSFVSFLYLIKLPDFCILFQFAVTVQLQTLILFAFANILHVSLCLFILCSHLVADNGCYSIDDVTPFYLRPVLFQFLCLVQSKFLTDSNSQGL